MNPILQVFKLYNIGIFEAGIRTDLIKQPSESGNLPCMFSEQKGSTS
jgi:hypothetical protein